jgi:predicted HTH transcriptional regulator
LKIDLWRSSRSEHQQLEFNEAKNQFDNIKLYKYCVAIANEGGGHLLETREFIRPISGFFKNGLASSA